MLAVNQARNLHINRVCGKEIPYVDGVFLTDAVHAVFCLLHFRRCPPKFQERYIGCRRHRDTDIRGFQPKESELRVRVVLELVDCRLLVLS